MGCDINFNSDSQAYEETLQPTCKFPLPPVNRISKPRSQELLLRPAEN